MIFFLNYIYSIFLSYCVSRKYRSLKVHSSALFLLLLPVFWIWLVICGGQYKVGTDYNSYFHIFNGNDLDRYWDNLELLFVGIVRLSNSIGIYGQGLFYIFYAINFIFLFLIIKRIKINQIYLFILLYITVTSLFNNQLNILRQTTACYIGTYAGILFLESKKKRSFLFMLAAFTVHKASIIFFLLYFNKYICRLSLNKLLCVFFVCFILGFLFSIDSLNILIPILPGDYAWHITGGFVVEQEFVSKFLKYIFVPLYLLSLNFFRKKELDGIEKSLHNWGWIAYCFRLLFVNLTIVNRMFDFFLIFSIFPLLYYLTELTKEKKLFLYISIVTFLSALYYLKVVMFASGEYLYNSIYF